jgi:hypothetical protein
MNDFSARWAGTKAGTAMIVALLVLPACAHAEYHSSIVFQNGAGQTALVKLVGRSARAVSVPKSESRTESAVAPGRYYIVVRYGDREQNYSYMKGDPFEVDESGNRYSEISITLYTVANGNYGSRPANKAEFDGAK